MARPRVYGDEFRERAVRLLREWREARGVTDGGYTAVAEQLGMQRETLRRWFIEDEVERGARPGLTRDERSRMAELERENRELRRANDILKSAAAFFGAELDRRQKKSSATSTNIATASGSSRSARSSRSPRPPTTRPRSARPAGAA